MYDAVVESFEWDAVQAFVDLDKLEALSSPEFRSGACRCYVVNVWEKKFISALSEIKRYCNVSLTEKRSNNLCYLIVRVV